MWWARVCVDSCDRLYDIYGRMYLFSVDFHHLKFEMDDQDEWENLYVVDAYHAGNVSAWWSSQRLTDWGHAQFTRFLVSDVCCRRRQRLTNGQNHSCDPNCKIFACYIDDADVDKPLLAVFATRDVEPWEELSFSYHGDIDVSMVYRGKMWPYWHGLRKSEKKLSRQRRLGKSWCVNMQCMHSVGVRRITVLGDCLVERWDSQCNYC